MRLSSKWDESAGVLCAQIQALAAAQNDVMVVWLYGSQANGSAAAHSDWDLAVAFDPVKLPDAPDAALERRLRPELLALDWQRALHLPEGKLSIVDINLAPIPLAFAIVDANCWLYCQDPGRRLREEGRIMSQMELNFRPRLRRQES
ncbi:MAG: type VII toxin-antitoxin system MntA family adenylyltransferase antitoxin [Aeromonas sp.]